LFDVDYDSDKKEFVVAIYRIRLPDPGKDMWGNPEPEPNPPTFVDSICKGSYCCKKAKKFMEEYHCRVECRVRGHVEPGC